MKRKKKIFVGIMAVLMSVSCQIAGDYTRARADSEQAVVQRAQDQKKGKNMSAGKVSRKKVNKFFSESAFVGNSISLGLKYYFQSQGKGFLGGPVMLVQGSYSFANDGQAGSQFQIVYKGKKCRARDAIAAAGVKRVFINMGTNDLWQPAERTYRDYVKYIKGIQKKNPGVDIFIEGTTPMCNSRNRKYLNNTAINELNSRMEKYCEKHSGLYYVDVSVGLRDGAGGLLHRYASDGYVHMTMAGYKIWTDNLVAFVKQLISQDKVAEKAVRQAVKSKKYEDYDCAMELLKNMKNGAKKTELKKKLDAIVSYLTL